MSFAPSDSDPFDPRYAGIVDDLARQGWSVHDGLLPEHVADDLSHEAWEQWNAGRFRQARVGTGPTKKLRPDIRNDHVQWLDPLTLTAAQQHYFTLMGELQVAINRSLMMGLHAFEAHFAVYTPGAFYSKHLDQFIGAHHRVVTSILYLNREWRATDGGQLRLYTDPSGAGEYVDILPLHGRLVTFLSGGLFHEVLPANRHRISLTGWHRIRALARED
ncbi:MAG TPA: 2OG-Fe(II) oxygenase [Mariprofundaceae bacterium]|nr:2OG-Fe(II) oxygenase [Mariprofundaceae bacterium]